MVLALAIVVVVAAASAWLAVGRGGGHLLVQQGGLVPVTIASPIPDTTVTAPSASSTTTIPDWRGPHVGVLVYAEQGSLRIVHLDNLAVIDEVPAPGQQGRPFVTGGAIVYVSSVQAWFLPPGSSEAHNLGPADRALPEGDPGLVWLVSDTPAGSFVRLAQLYGPDLIPRVPLPPKTTVVGASTPDLLLQRVDNNDLELWTPDGRTPVRRLGTAKDVVEANGVVVAWRGGGQGQCSEGGGCPLHLTDVVSAHDRIVQPPPGSHGFIGGGAISPDGRTLAAFVLMPNANPAAKLVLVDLPTSKVTGPIELSNIPTGNPPTAAVVWSPASQWLFFCGLNGDMKDYLPGDTSAGTIPESASYAFTVT